MLHYKIPPEPSRSRVYVWRKLKRLGALLLHEAIWVLPATPRTIENLQWLAMEITELKGDAMVWQGQLLLAGHDDALVSQFEEQVNNLYEDILRDLNKKDADLTALGKRFQQAHMEDYFDSALGTSVRAALLKHGNRS